MLKHLTRDQVLGIISGAEELNAKYPPSKTGTRLSDVTSDDLTQYEKDAEKLKQVIAALSHDARMELAALLSVGRDYSAASDDYVEVVNEAQRNPYDHDVDTIAEISPALPIYLRDGMKKIGL